MRMSKDEYYLGIACAASKRSTCLRRRYGAVIVNDDEIIATGYNGSPRGEVNCCDTGFCKRAALGIAHNTPSYANDCHSVHAEQNALLSASRRETIGATLYLYGEEFDNSSGEWKSFDAVACPLCQRMIQNSGIEKIVNQRGERKCL